MALASSADVELALGRVLADGEDVSNLLDTASDRVEGYLGYTPDPVPPPVVRVVAEMVAEVINKPAVTTASYGASGYNTSRESAAVQLDSSSITTRGSWLTKEQKRVLRRFRTSKFRGVFSINTAPNANYSPADIPTFYSTTAWGDE